jgi:hypothetical protein
MVGVGDGEAVGVIVEVFVGVRGMAVNVLVSEGNALGEAIKAGISVCWSGVIRSPDVQPTRSNPRKNTHNEIVRILNLTPITPYYNPYAFNAAL